MLDVNWTRTQGPPTYKAATSTGAVMKYGYARVSTDDQDLTVQQQALTAYGCDKVLGEKYTGRSTGCPRFALR